MSRAPRLFNINRKLPLTILNLFIVLGTANISPTLAATIGIDARHGDTDSNPDSNLATGVFFQEFRATIEAAGNSLVELTSFTPPSLTGIDAIILRQAPRTNVVYTATEIAAIHGFVSDGHGLLLMGEGGYSTDSTVQNLNALAQPFGVAYGVTPLHAQGFTVIGLVAHPLTLGVTAIGLDYYRQLVTISEPAIDLTILADDNDVLAAVNGLSGSGNVVLVGDTSLWSSPYAPTDRSIASEDNQLLLQNVISFITVPVLRIERQGSSLRLSWSSSLSGYHLEYTHSVSLGAWQTLPNDVVVVAGSYVVLDSIAASQRFYRLAPVRNVGQIRGITAKDLRK